MLKKKREREKAAAVGKRSWDHLCDSHPSVQYPQTFRWQLWRNEAQESLVLFTIPTGKLHGRVPLGTWGQLTSQASQPWACCIFCLLVTLAHHHCLALKEDLDSCFPSPCPLPPHIHHGGISQIAIILWSGVQQAQELRVLCVLHKKIVNVAFLQGKGLQFV